MGQFKRLVIKPVVAVPGCEKITDLNGAGGEDGLPAPMGSRSLSEMMLPVLGTGTRTGWFHSPKETKEMQSFHSSSLWCSFQIAPKSREHQLMSALAISNDLTFILSITGVCCNQVIFTKCLLYHENKEGLHPRAARDWTSGFWKRGDFVGNPCCWQGRLDGSSVVRGGLSTLPLKQLRNDLCCLRNDGADLTRYSFQGISCRTFF